jgi:hypothetical protein
MLGNPEFYHHLTRKAVALFGRLFDDIHIVRRENQDGAEVQRFLVPIIYAPKEKMVTRILSDPDLQKQLGIVLPRMSFEITGISYDANRKQNSKLFSARPNTANSVVATYMGVPYDIKFALNVYARHIDDGTHIVEQILPFFNPDFTVTAKMIPDLGALKDIPVILDGISNEIEYEGNFDSVRYVYWTLNFTMKMDYYGPIQHPKIIRSVYVNVHNDEALNTGYITQLNTINSNGVFKVDDYVFQGDSYNTANAYGIVLMYNGRGVDEANGRLVLGATQGQFVAGQVIHAVSTNGHATIENFSVPPLKLAQIRIQPNPFDVMPNEDYGYDIQVLEAQEINANTANN